MAAAAVPLLVLSLAATAASTAVSISAQKQAAAQEQNMANQQAAAEERLARQRAAQLERKRSRLLAEQRAAVVGRGVKLSGSPLELLAETNEILDLDINRVLTAGSERAALLRSGGRAAVSRARAAVPGTILGGVGSLAGQGLSGTLSIRQAGLLS